MGSIPTKVKNIFSLPRVVPCFPLLGLTPSGLFMGLSRSLNYTSELILRPTIFGKTGSSSVVLWDFNFALCPSELTAVEQFRRVYSLETGV